MEYFSTPDSRKKSTIFWTNRLASSKNRLLFCSYDTCIEGEYLVLGTTCIVFCVYHARCSIALCNIHDIQSLLCSIERVRLCSIERMQPRRSAQRMRGATSNTAIDLRAGAAFYNDTHRFYTIVLRPQVVTACS